MVKLLKSKSKKFRKAGATAETDTANSSSTSSLKETALDMDDFTIQISIKKRCLMMAATAVCSFASFVSMAHFFQTQAGQWQVDYHNPSLRALLMGNHKLLPTPSAIYAGLTTSAAATTTTSATATDAAETTHSSTTNVASVAAETVQAVNLRTSSPSTTSRNNLIGFLGTDAAATVTTTDSTTKAPEQPQPQQLPSCGNLVTSNQKTWEDILTSNFTWKERSDRTN
jgi:hypothetical protein